MKILVLAIQWLSLGVVAFGAWLCLWHVCRERAETEELRRLRLPATAVAQPVPTLAPEESEVDERTAAL